MSIKDHLIINLDKDSFIESGVYGFSAYDTASYNLESFKVITKLEENQEEWVPSEFVDAYRRLAVGIEPTIEYKSIYTIRAGYKTILNNFKFFLNNSKSYRKINVGDTEFYINKGVILDEHLNPLIRLYLKLKNEENRIIITDVKAKIDHSVYNKKTKINDAILKTLLPILVKSKWNISICDLSEDIWDHPVMPNDPDNANRDIYSILNNYFNN
jgi:hypothetical protein